jgi:hypothetical protein
MFESRFFGASAESRARYLRWVQAFSEDLVSALPVGPYAGDGPAQLSALLATDICPDEGISFEALRERLRAAVRELTISPPRVESRRIGSQTDNIR